MSATRYDWEWFTNSFAAISQLDLKAYKRAQMERRINSFMHNHGCIDYKSFIFLLKTDTATYHRFMDYITINVSEFFRNYDSWRILEEEVIPRLLQRRSLLKVWSAGCSTGEEAYSLAMLFCEKFSAQVQSIKATDLDWGVLKKATEALYSSKAVKTLPESYRQKYMQPEGDHYRVIDEIKRMVKFEQHNLLKDPYDDNYDLILCRNVFIYMTEASKQDLYRKFAAALRPGGLLFIGSTEQIFYAAEAGFQTYSTFFYQKT